jgi:hypothetical protein
MRFAMGSFVSLANTDFSHDSYGSTDSSYLVFDAKVQYKFAPDWTATAGINNIGNNKALVNPNPIRSAPSSLASDTTSAARRSSKPRQASARRAQASTSATSRRRSIGDGPWAGRERSYFIGRRKKAGANRRRRASLVLSVQRRIAWSSVPLIESARRGGNILRYRRFTAVQLQSPLRSPSR